ncbi:MAG: carboxypeptidase regulatory-like domain-containing protein [Deltaproteobacteria bacterium]|nr:MAG: carboxypeptidase regulatory-like domain-containing protein [Deltaproteobacteria bacterium]
MAGSSFRVCFETCGFRRVLACLAGLALVGVGAAHAGDPFADGVRSFTPGAGAGFGQDGLPGIVLGPPEGGGLTQGSTDVLSLGDGGRIVVAFRNNLVTDGPGDDFVVFENAFHAGSPDGPIFDELAFVEVSVDGRRWVRFPADPDTGAGMAGRTPVLAGTASGIDPLSAEAGGDRFDLADVGMSHARLIRIVDAGAAVDDAGNHVPGGGKAGFDLDAVAALHSVRPARVRGVVLAGGVPVEGALVRLIAEDSLRRPWRRTGPSGRFRFWPLVPSGRYRVRARRAGLGRARTTVSLDSARRVAAVTLELK